MQETDELEPQQYQRLYWEADVPVRDLRVRLMRRLLYAAIVLFLVICAVAAVVRFPDQIELPFVLKNELREEVYIFPYTVYLLEAYVETGDEVNPGNPLLRITSPEIAGLINSYREVSARVENLNNTRRVAEMRQQDMVRANIRQSLQAVEEQQRLMVLAYSTRLASENEMAVELKEAEEKLLAYQNLRAENIGARFDLVAQETRLAQLQSSLSQVRLRFEKDSVGIQHNIAQRLLDKELAENQLAKLIATFRADSTEAAVDLDLANRRIADAFGAFEIADGAVIVKSALQGRVSFLFDGEKEIRGGTTAIKISNDHQPDYAFVKCPPATVGKLKVNQVCHLKVSSFPFYEFGTVTGHVRHVSLSPDENGEYNLHLTVVNPGRLQGLLQPGLTGTAVVIIEEKTLLQYFFRGLNKRYHRLMDGDMLGK